MIEIALFQPDIPQNVGAAMRLCACLDIKLHIIEPCSFPWNIRKIRQAGMDYVSHTQIIKHTNWESFLEETANQRKILMTTKAADNYLDCHYENGDILIAGSESAGAPDFVHNASDQRVCIMMKEGMRSLNIINATAMISGEALRQTRSSPSKVV